MIWSCTLEPHKQVGSKGNLPTCWAPYLDVGSILESWNVCASTMGENKGHFTYKPRVCDHVIVRALDSHPKGRTTDMVCQKFCQAYLLEVNLTQIVAKHETLFVVYHIRIRADISSMIISSNPYTFTF
jgi:hypothetical protein